MTFTVSLLLMALVASNAIALPQPQSSPAASINISTTNTSVNNTSNSTTANGTIIISANSSNSDLNILNFALTLENLESNFYTQLLSKFSDQDFTSIQLPGVRATIQEIATSESDHVSFLNTFINSTFGQGQAVPACQYNFPLNNGLQSALQVAGVLEKVGVSAYDGAVSSIQNPNIITAAAAIATVEGRHASILNVINRINSAPNAFDAPLGARSVISLAAPFITSCPFQLPAQPFNSTLSTNPSSARINDVLALNFNAVISATQASSLFCNFQTGITHARSPITINNGSESCQIPQQVQGFGEAVVFVVDQDKDVGLTDDGHVLAGPTFLTINP